MSTISLSNKASSPSRRDGVLRGAVTTAAVAGIALLAGIIFFVVQESLPALTEIGVFRFASDASWHPLEGAFNMAPMLVGTCLVTVGAVALALPLALGAVVFGRFYLPPRARAWVRGAIIVLAGIPSVVFGLWGLVTLVPLIAAWQPPGASLLSASIVLAIMITPTVALLSDSALEHFPREQVMAARALGLSNWAIWFHVMLPARKHALATAAVLATLRALGETMAVLMVAGNVPALPTSLSDPVRTLTANIALEMAYAVDTHRAALFVSGLVLLVLVMALVLTLGGKSKTVAAA